MLCALNKVVDTIRSKGRCIGLIHIDASAGVVLNWQPVDSFFSLGGRATEGSFSRSNKSYLSARSHEMRPHLVKIKKRRTHKQDQHCQAFWLAMHHMRMNTLEARSLLWIAQHRSCEVRHSALSSSLARENTAEQPHEQRRRDSREDFLFR